MKVSNLIKKLQELQTTCGDCQVKVYSDTNDTFEYASTALPNGNFKEILIVTVKGE